jgi:hypothetical protein
MSSWNDVQPSSSSWTSPKEVRSPAKYALNLWINVFVLGALLFRMRALFAGSVDREGGGRSAPP